MSGDFLHFEFGQAVQELLSVEISFASRFGCRCFFGEFCGNDWWKRDARVIVGTVVSRGCRTTPYTLDLGERFQRYEGLKFARVVFASVARSG